MILRSFVTLFVARERGKKERKFLFLLLKECRLRSFESKNLDLVGGGIG